MIHLSKHATLSNDWQARKWKWGKACKESFHNTQKLQKMCQKILLLLMWRNMAFKKINKPLIHSDKNTVFQLQNTWGGGICNSRTTVLKKSPFHSTVTYGVVLLCLLSNPYALSGLKMTPGNITERIKPMPWVIVGNYHQPGFDIYSFWLMSNFGKKSTNRS